MHFLPLMLTLSSWPSVDGIFFGYCIIEISNQQVCSEIVENTGNFAGYCDDFARERGAILWTTRFNTNFDRLNASMDVYCDVLPEGEGEGWDGEG